MRKILLLLIALMAALHTARAARTAPVSGRVVDDEGSAVEYATVVLQRDGRQIAGAATDTDGRFELAVPKGDYTLSVQYLGYDPETRQVTIADGTELEPIVLHGTSTEIEGVVVRGQLIRREADRFVVDVANAPTAIGKDGVELLEYAPGIWIDDDKITVNGKSGSKIYVNDRELRMEPEQLLTYLKSLRAEEIQKIEVVPTTGADYDADSSGGVIRITLRKRRENGLDGSLAVNTTQGSVVRSYAPSGNINVHTGRLDFYASAWGWLGRTETESDERTDYDSRDAGLTAHSEMRDDAPNWGGNAGAVVELAPRHSIGAEFEYWENGERGPNDSYTDYVRSGITTRTDSRYDTRSTSRSCTATFNYIWKIDTLGSTFKVLADHTRRTNDGRNDKFSRTATPGLPTVDSTYRDASSSRYLVTTATAALEKKFSERWLLKTGAKYTRNDMRNEAVYEYLKRGAWLRNEEQSVDVDYTENIAAAYASASARLGRWSLVAGLRGEYTHTDGRNGVGQDYFSLFPNANVSWSLTEEGSYSLVGQYARTISRPNFWSLNPQRSQLSDYTYQCGNPELAPSFAQEISLTLVLAYKYTITGGVNIRRDDINQTMQPDADNPDMLAVRWVNYDRTHQYYVTANLPFQPAKWWSLNVNALYMRWGQRLDQHEAEIYRNFLRANASTTFTLPAKFFIDLSYSFQGGITLGNVSVSAQHHLNAGLKKRFGERFTCAFSVRNLLPERPRLTAEGEGFVREVRVRQTWNERTFRLGVTYNFKAGKAFRKRTVEAGSAEEKSRL